MSSSTRPISAGSRSFQSRTRPLIRCHALAMSACWVCGQPSALHTPCFQSVPRGTTGHAVTPSRAGLTACQMSMNGWPTTSVCAPPGPRRTAVGDAGLLRTGHEVVDEHAEPTPRAGLELLDDARRDRRRRRGIRPPRPRHGGRRPTPARRVRRRAGLRRRSGSPMPPWPSPVPPPSRMRCAPVRRALHVAGR